MQTQKAPGDLSGILQCSHRYLPRHSTLARLWQRGQQSKRNGEPSHPSPLTLTPPLTPHPHTTSHPSPSHPSPSHHPSPLTLTPPPTPHPHTTSHPSPSHPSPSHHPSSISLTPPSQSHYSPINPTHLQACNRTDILGCLCVLKTVSFLEGRVHCQVQLHHILKHTTTGAG